MIKSEKILSVSWKPIVEMNTHSVFSLDDPPFARLVCFLVILHDIIEFQSSSSSSSSSTSFPGDLRKLPDLTDGVGLCSLVSLYCPQEMPWREIALGDPPSMADSLYNIQVMIEKL
jgi:hypothetical protein